MQEIDYLISILLQSDLSANQKRLNLKAASDCHTGGRKSSLKARNSGQSGSPMGELWVLELENMSQVGDLNSPTMGVTNAQRLPIEK